MVTKIVFRSILVFFSSLPCISPSSAQVLAARMEYIFVDNEETGQYSGGLAIKEGTLKIGQTITVNDDGGHKYQFTVKEIKDYDTDNLVPQAIGPISCFIVIQSTDGRKADQITGGFTFGSEERTASEKVKHSTTCMLNGKKWHGVNFYKSASYFPTGSALLKMEKPLIILAFKAADLPDNRQLTFQIVNQALKVGKVPYDTFEAGISGSEEGKPEKDCLTSNWKDGQANTIHTPFNLQITKAEKLNNHYIVSGIYEGKLYGFNLFEKMIGKMCGDIALFNGKFENIEVEIIK
jgi:hypothetical protein